MPGKQVNIDGPAKWEGVMTHIIREAPAELAAGDVIDAEVVDDEEDPLECHEREEAQKRRAQWESEARDRAREELVRFERPQRGSANPPH